MYWKKTEDILPLSSYLFTFVDNILKNLYN